MKNLKRVLALVLLVSMLFVLAACSTKDKLIGGWVIDSYDAETFAGRKCDTYACSADDQQRVSERWLCEVEVVSCQWGNEI